MCCCACRCLFRIHLPSPSRHLFCRCFAPGHEVAMTPCRSAGGYLSFSALCFFSCLSCLFLSSMLLLMTSSFLMSFCVCFFFSFLHLFVGWVWGVLLRHLVCPQAYGMPSGRGWGCFSKHMVCPRAYGVPSGCKCAVRYLHMVCPQAYGVSSDDGCGSLRTRHHPLLPSGFQLDPKAPPPVPHAPHVPFPLPVSPFHAFWAG